MNGNLRCPGCNREIGINNRFCPYCGSKLDAATASVPQNQDNNLLNGRYRMDRVLDKCVDHVSYLAEDITLQMKVVVNEFASKDLVQEEARNKAKLSGLPGIAEMRDYFEMGNTAYTVMEWLNGGSLQDFIDKNGYSKPSDVQLGLGKRITMDMAKQIMEPIISSLIKVHAAGVLHGDICPDNMVFNNKGILKLLQPFTQSMVQGNSDKTVILNMSYEPIENYHDSGSKGPWSDVYSLCATMYKCVTGIQPMEAGDRSHQDTLKRPSELGIQIDPYDEAALMTGLAVNADKRFVDMKVLHNAMYRSQRQSASTHTMPSQAAQTQASPMQAHPMQPAAGQPAPTQTMPSKAAPKQTVPTQMPPVNVQNQRAENPKKKKTGAVIGIIVAVLLFLGIGGIGICIFVFPDILPLDKLPPQVSEILKKKDTESDTETKTEEKAPLEISEKDLLKIELIDEQAQADESYPNQKEVLEQYYTFVEDYNAVEQVSEQVEKCFEKYQEGILEHVDMLAAQDAFPNMYLQMKLELDSVLELAERFEKAGIEIDDEDTKSKGSKLQTEYKNKLVTNFDTKAFENINSNGVVSRSVLWAAMENADQTGLFDSSNPEDSLRLRYAAALALHIDSEIAGMTESAAVTKIYDSLEATDYSPLLLYYLSYNYGDDKGKEWYKKVDEILTSTVGDFDAMGVNDKRNMIFYLSANDGEYLKARTEIREYMEKNFVKP